MVSIPGRYKKLLGGLQTVHVGEATICISPRSDPITEKNRIRKGALFILTVGYTGV